MRLPTCRLGYWINSRRCARSMNTMKVITATATTTTARMSMPDSAPWRPSSRVCAIAEGSCATMPDMMISEVPLPMPRAVICSPSHIRNMVPPVSVIMVEMRNNRPGSADHVAGALEADRDAVGLEGRQQHRQVARVLVHDLAALLALLLELLERGRDRRHQLDDDGGRDVGHDVQGEDRHAVDAAAREHVEHAEDAARPGSGTPAPRCSDRCRAAGYRCRADRPAARRG